jgi:hypothetical protein
MSSSKSSKDDASDIQDRARVKGFALALDSSFKFNGEIHLAAVFIQKLRDQLDALHCSRIIDPKYKLPDVSDLISINERDNEGRKEENKNFEFRLNIHKTQFEERVRLYNIEAAIVNAMEGGEERTQRGDLLRADNAELVIMQNGRPKQAPYVRLLLPTEAAQIADFLKTKREDEKLAETALQLFKSKLGDKLSDKLEDCWDDPVTSNVDKAKSTMDLILQYTQTNIEDQVATLQNDINVLLPATTATGGLLLHQQMCFLQRCLGKIGKDHKLPESSLLAIISKKLQGPIFSNLKFYHQQYAGNTEPTVRAASEYGEPPLKKANQSQVTWSELGENLQQLVAPESDAAPTTLVNCSTAKSQEEAVSYYTQANSQFKPFAGARIPPPANGLPGWTQSSSKAFQQFQPPRPISNPFQQYPQQFLQQQQQQQQQSTRQVRPPFKPAGGGAYVPRGATMGQAPRLNIPQGSARQGLVPVHDRNGKFSYFMQADGGEEPTASSSSAAAAESPFMTFGATEESTSQDDACYFVDGSGNWFQFDN